MTREDRSVVLFFVVLAATAVSMALQTKACIRREQDDDHAFMKRCDDLHGSLLYARKYVCVQKGAWVEVQP